MRADEKGIDRFHFVTALHVVNGCNDLIIVLEQSAGSLPPPVSFVKTNLSYVDIRNDLAALIPEEGKERLFPASSRFRLASEGAESTETVEIVFYSANSYKRDHRSTPVTILPPRRLADITEGMGFPWPEMQKSRLAFLDTQVIRMPGVAWPGFSGAPLVSMRESVPTALGVVDGGVNDKLQWAVPVWGIQWKEKGKALDELALLLSLAARLHLFHDTPVRTFPIASTPNVRFIGVPAELLDGSSRRGEEPTADDIQSFYSFVQECELSNEQAAALSLPKGGDAGLPYLASAPVAAAACKAMGAQLLSTREFENLIKSILAVDEQACFSNLGLRAADRKCRATMASNIENPARPQFDHDPSLKYGPVTQYPSHLGLRNVIGNAWEWTRESTLAGGAVDTKLTGRDQRRRLLQLTGREGQEGAVRCIQYR